MIHECHKGGDLSPKGDQQWLKYWDTDVDFNKVYLFKWRRLDATI